MARCPVRQYHGNTDSHLLDINSVKKNCDYFAFINKCSTFVTLLRVHYTLYFINVNILFIMKKLLFTLAAVLMASTAFAGHWVTFEAEDFDYTSGNIFIEKEGVYLQGYGRIDYDHFRFYANNTITISNQDGFSKIEFTCIGEDDSQYGPGNLELQTPRGDYNYSGYIGLWEDNLDIEAPLREIVFLADYQVRCTKINVYVLGEDTPEPPVVDQVGAPTFEGYTVDGIHGYGVHIYPTTEGSTIMYRVFIDEDGEWVLVTDWTEYMGADMEIWMTEADAKYRVEAYAFIGQVESQQVAYEFVVQPYTGINEMNAGKAVAGVRYFNVAGQEMQEANGLTIVVTTYTDGTTSAVKVVK